MRTEPTDNEIFSTPVPRALEDFIKERVASQGYHTVSEYVRALIRADQEQAARQRLEAKLLEAVERGDYRSAQETATEAQAEAEEVMSRTLLVRSVARVDILR
jgi:antitoxin ParD1/3/4